MQCGLQYGFRAVEFDVMLSKDGAFPVLGCMILSLVELLQEGARLLINWLAEPTSAMGCRFVV